MSILEYISVPTTGSDGGRTLGEINGVLEEGNKDIVVYDQDLTSYPHLSVDPKQILKPSLTTERAAEDAFIPIKMSIWKKAWITFRNEGFIQSIRVFSSMDFSIDRDCHNRHPNVQSEPDPHASSPPEATLTPMDQLKLSLVYLISRLKPYLRHLHPLSLLQKISLLIIMLYDSCLRIYGSLYPYHMLGHTDQIKVFNRNLDWSTGIIRSFRWHPTEYKCAMALVNDDVLIHASGSSSTPVLRHPLQKRISDMCWRPTKSNILAVACEKLVFIWTIPDVDHRVSWTSARILDNTITTPITCVSYDPSGNWLMICGPNTSKIMLKDESDVPDPKGYEKNPDGTTVTKPKYDRIIRKMGHGVFRVIWSPDGNRMVTCGTSNFVRIFEKFGWSSRVWGFDFLSDVCQSVVWSRPFGKFLLMAAKHDSVIYALTFLDKATKGHVGGTDADVMKVIDVSEYELPNGSMVGGVIHDMIWDHNSERLVVSFRDNPEYLAVFKTKAKPILEIIPHGFIHGMTGEKPLLMEFHDCFKRGSLLTICWSSGVVSHIPFQYTPGVSNNRSQSVMSSTPRNLTKYCASPVLISSPILSPIAKTRTSQGIFDENEGRKSSDHVTSPIRNHHLSSFLASDSVISCRKPVLFSQLNKTHEDVVTHGQE